MYVAPVFTNKVASHQLIQIQRGASATRMERSKRGRDWRREEKIYKVKDIHRNSGNWRHYVRSAKITISGVPFFDFRHWQSFSLFVFNQFIKPAKNKSTFQNILSLRHPSILWVCNNTKSCAGFYLCPFFLLSVRYCITTVVLVLY